MFENIRYRLLLSYLSVLAGILLVFSVAVRMTFIYNLTQRQIDELTLLAKAAATTADFGEGQLTLDDAFAASRLTARDEALQWFNSRGTLIGQSGEDIVRLPVEPGQSVQIQPRSPQQKSKIIAVTLTVFGRQGVPTGFVRASQSLAPVDVAIRRLDWGFGLGITVALVFSWLGGIWLTRQSMKPIENSFDRLKQFTADASHELRSPLTAIISNGQVALKYPSGMRQGDAEKFDAIISAAQQMKQLTEDLLFLSRTDRLPPQVQEGLNLSQLLAELVQLYESQATDKEMTLRFTAPEQLWINGDLLQLNRLFTNLIVNALQYSLPGTAVEVTAYRSGKQIMVEVQDSGIGMSPEQTTKVFDRFWRASESRSYASGGSGLGLAIAQAVAKAHGGQITVTSRLGEGSCFRVCLPTAPTVRKGAIAKATLQH